MSIHARFENLAARQANTCLELIPRLMGALKKIMGSPATSVEWEGRRYSMAQLKMVWLVSCQPDVRMVQIARALCLRTPTVTHHVRRLVARGLLRCRVTPGDRQTVTLTLTPKGARLVRDVMARYREYLTAVFSHFPPDTIRRLPKVLEEAIRLLEPVTTTLDPGAVCQALLAHPVGKGMSPGRRTSR